ncbi:unnamed protein product [marine sediment metagenome]|uniref:Uncharacterized protein n=1 Tax=marine sediment metagenome TaxID=412755 RepID=X0VA28_9ZZZZ
MNLQKLIGLLEVELKSLEREQKNTLNNIKEIIKEIEREVRDDKLKEG